MRNDKKNWGLLLLLACVWGSSFILMKRGMFTIANEPIFSDSQVASLRMTIAALALLPFAIKGIKSIKTLKELALLAVVGFTGNFIPAYLFTYSETGISSGYAGMLNSFTPIFSMLIGLLIFNVRITFIQFIGLIIGTFGIVFLVLAGNNSAENLNMVGTWRHVAAIVFATFLYGISLNTIKHTLQKFKAIEITSLAFVIVLIPSIIANIKFGTYNTITTNSHALEGLGYIAILSIIGTAFAVILFNQLITATSTLFASSVTYFIPIVAVFIGISFGETINIQQISAMLIILLGVFIANYWVVLFAKKSAN
jgi:drug/metabolite transporter (DMT)-like permease